MGLKRIVPPFQGSGVDWPLLTQAFSLGFVISPLRGSSRDVCVSREAGFRL